MNEHFYRVSYHTYFSPPLNKTVLVIKIYYLTNLIQQHRFEDGKEVTIEQKPEWREFYVQAAKGTLMGEPEK
jgi:hypothetical protein